MTDQKDVDWMPDDFSNNCLICESEFTLRNRRHHCRRCGRLVCKSCSSNFANLSDQPMLEGQEQRVCDDCWANLQRKKDVASVVNYQRAKEIALLSAASKVSDSLLRVYELDGNFKTLVYEEDTTAGEVAAKVCMGQPSVVALFEVERDLRDPDEFHMIDSHETIVNIFKRWDDQGKTTAKIVVPMYSSSPEEMSSSPPPRSNVQPKLMAYSDETDTSSSNASDPQQRISQLEEQYEELKKKYDILFAAHKKVTKTDEDGVPRLRPLRNPSFMSYNRGNSFSLSSSAAATLMNSPQNDGFKPLGAEFSFASVESSGDRDSSFDNGQPMIGDLDIADDVTIASTDEYGSSAAQTPTINTDQRILRSGFLEKKSSTSLLWRRRYVVLTADGVLRWYSTNATQSTAQVQGFLAIRNIVRVTRGSSSNTFITVSTNSKVVFRTQTTVECAEWITVLQSMILGAPVPDFLPDLYRTRTNDSVANQSDLLETHLAPAALTGITVPKLKLFFNKIHSVDAFFGSFDESLRLTLSSGIESPEDLLNAYEVVDAMQKLYSRVILYGEEWSAALRDWLLRSLRATMVLPIDRPELLMTVLQCMTRESMLHAPETLKVVDQVIELSFDRDADEASFERNTLAGVLETVKGLVNTLHMVVDELIPLVPDHFNVIDLFQKKAEAKIRTHVMGFYMANKDTIENKDILTLLSWAEGHKTVMQRFGVQQFSDDFRTLEVDLVKRYSQQVQALQRQWMQRIHDADVDAVVQKLGESVITNWPEDLANCLRQQLKVALQLPGEVGANVCGTCLNLLQEFRNTQAQWLNGSSTTLTIERMCAYSNNHTRFANILTDLQPDICDEVDEDSAEKVNDSFHEVIACFTEESARTVPFILKHVTEDIRGGMQDMFFVQEWREGRQAVETLRGTVQSYTKDIRVWLAQFGQYHKFASNMIRDIITIYFEQLITSAISVDAATLDRLEEDVDILTAFFRLYEDVMPEETLEYELRPLKNFLMFFRIDHRKMGHFVRVDISEDFGCAALKVWQHAMTMKNESKQLQDAMYDAIVHSWAPPVQASRVLPDIVDKLKNPKRGKFKI